MEFDAQKIREEQTPPIPRTWMAKKMGVGYMFLYRMERGKYPWPPKRKEQFNKLVVGWRENPPEDRRKRRNDFGKVRGRRKRTSGVDKIPAHCPPACEVPVPHPHGEIVEIG